MTPDRTWFVVASKSGGTVEVASMERFFWGLMTKTVGERAGRHFIAITDPGTALEQLAATCAGIARPSSTRQTSAAGFRPSRCSGWCQRH